MVLGCCCCSFYHFSLSSDKNRRKRKKEKKKKRKKKKGWTHFGSSVPLNFVALGQCRAYQWLCSFGKQHFVRLSERTNWRTEKRRRGRRRKRQSPLLRLIFPFKRRGLGQLCVLPVTFLLVGKTFQISLHEMPKVGRTLVWSELMNKRRKKKKDRKNKIIKNKIKEREK